jgi:hypothetical protein
MEATIVFLEHRGNCISLLVSHTKLRQVRFAQTVHLSCTDTNTVSKWTETSFDMTHVT